MSIHPPGDDSSVCALAGKWRYQCEQDFGPITEPYLLGHAERLAQSALAITYGHDLAACGPVADSFAEEEGAIRCRFRFAGNGLATTDGAAPRLFFIAGEDRVFHPAEARIEKSTVVVRHAGVPHPVAVRYAWADNPEGCNLANNAGLPASPFRSDRW